MASEERARLLEALEAYHDEPEYNEMLEVAAKHIDRVPHVLIEFLRGWGELARNLPKKGPRRRRLERSLARWLSTHRIDLQELGAEKIWLADLEMIGPRIEELFDSLAWIEKGFASTAAGKTLHVLLPDLCVLWDAAQVRELQGYGEEGKDYVEYLRSRRAILDDALEDARLQTGFGDPTVLVEWIIEQHARRHGVSRPPVTKLLDEVNYDERESVQSYLRSVKGGRRTRR